MAEMVADYATAIRELQPSGPYHLAGWSTGGIFAFALAEALESAGEPVALLALSMRPYRPYWTMSTRMMMPTSFACL